MRFSAQYLCTVLFTLLSFPTLLAAQTTPAQTSKTPHSSVSGRVTIKEKGVGGVMVVLRKSEVGLPIDQNQKAITDPDGFYHITNVPPGNYDVVPSVPALVPEKREISSKRVLVSEDDNVEGINFALVRGGVITGRITDADGRPIIQELVNIYQENAFAQGPQQPQQPPRPVFPATTVQTDDRGIYRVYGLQAGRYKVASGRGEDTFANGGNVLWRSYKQVFHPDVTEPDKARVIEVSEGSEATDVDITLGRALQMFSASGRVIEGEKGLPLPNVRFSVRRMVGQREEFANSLTISNIKGEFIIEGLLPGKYAINQLQNQNNEFRAETLNFEIIDQDISGVVVKLVRGASVSGVIVIESEDKAVLAKLSELQVRGFIPGQTGVVSSTATSPVGPDGSFRIAGLGSGMLYFNIGAMNRPLPPKGLSMGRVERDGVVVSQGIDVKDGEQVTGVRLIVSYGSAVIRGVVTTGNGPLPEGTRVSVTLAKPGERGVGGTRPPIVDQRGRFLLEGIPAGTYELTTIIGMTTPQSPARVFRQMVTVQEGSTQDLSITVDLAAPPARPELQ